MTKHDLDIQEHLAVQGIEVDSPYNIYKLKETGQVIFQVEIESNKGGEPVEIGVLSDVHINVTNKEDESDQEVMYTKQCRGTIFAEPGVVGALSRAMDVCALTDLTVITGDLLDYYSRGAAEVVKKEILEKTDKVMIAAAIHDVSKQCMTNLPNKLSYDERIKLLEEFWPNDIHFAVKTLKNKVTAVVIDNDTTNHYWGFQADALAKECEKAREDGRIILLFQHKPISTNKPENKATPSIITLWHSEWNLYDESNIGGPDFGNEDDKNILAVIKNNADVIRGIFCGHYHDPLYSEIDGKYTDANGNVHDAVIPQYNVPSCPYLGYAGVLTRIIVK